MHFRLYLLQAGIPLSEASVQPSQGVGGALKKKKLKEDKGSGQFDSWSLCGVTQTVETLHDYLKILPSAIPNFCVEASMRFYTKLHVDP